MDVLIFETQDELVSKLCDEIARLSNSSGKKFCVGLSGGSLLNLLKPLKQRKDIDFFKWHVFMCDERLVPLDHKDSNYLGAMNAFLSEVPGAKVYPVSVDLNSKDASAKYEEKVVEVLGENPAFDLLLLGIGPDGHICSLFPGHPLLNSTRIVDFLENSPKPPPKRVTLTMKVVNNAKAVIFPITDKAKSNVVKRIIDMRDESLPAARVAPKNGTLTWLLYGAGDELSREPQE